MGTGARQTQARAQQSSVNHSNKMAAGSATNNHGAANSTIAQRKVRSATRASDIEPRQVGPAGAGVSGNNRDGGQGSNIDNPGA